MATCARPGPGRVGRWLGWAWLCLGFVVAPVGGAEPASWTPEAVDVLMRRVAERARRVSTDTHAPIHVFDKLAVVESLAADGTVKKVTEKKYEVLLRHGMTHNRLVAVDGVPLGPEQSAAQSEREQRWRDTYSAHKGGASAADRADDVLNERLFQRFAFTPTGEETIRGRRCVALEFRPKPEGLPEERLVDKVINLMHGRIWVDVEEAEIVRADAETRGTLRLWGGLLGSLDSFRIHMDRERSGLGPWFNRHVEIQVRARKLFTPVHMRAREVGSRMRLATGER